MNLFSYLKNVTSDAVSYVNSVKEHYKETPEEIRGVSFYMSYGKAGKSGINFEPKSIGVVLKKFGVRLVFMDVDRTSGYLNREVKHFRSKVADIDDGFQDLKNDFEKHNKHMSADAFLDLQGKIERVSELLDTAEVKQAKRFIEKKENGD